MLHTEIHTHDLHQAVCTLSLHVTATFNLIRGTNLTELFSCAMFGDGLCVTIHPLLLLSWIPSLFASVTSLLHLVFHNCSDLPSDVSIEFSKLAENSSTYRVFNVSSPLTESSSKLSLFSHCPHVTASTDVLNLFASRL